MSRLNSLPTVDDCQGCGVCCLHMGYPPYLGMHDGEQPEEAWFTLPESLKADLMKYVESYPPPPDGQLEGPCVWFDPSTKRCRNHEYRPRVCRDFSVASQGCLDWRRAYRIGET